jgi:arginine:pyruvate transaminase
MTAHTMRFSSRVDGLGGTRVAAWDIHHAAFEAQRRGENVILLSVGDPDFASPAPIIDAAIASLKAGDTHYTDVPGRPALRAAIAREHGRHAGQSVSAENVVVLAGAQNAVFSASLCLLDAGDEAVVFDPVYLTYEACIRAAGAVPVSVPTRVDTGFRIDPAALAAAVTPRTRAIFLTNPSNPTGVMCTRGELEAIAAVAREHDLWVVSDEVYGALTFERAHVAIASLPGMAERTVTVSSLSKSHAMTGWRAGWIVAPRALAAHVENLAICMLYGLPGFVQQAALAAIGCAEMVTAQMREVYRHRRDLTIERLAGVPGLRCLRPEAGMFMMVDVRGTGLSAHAFSWALFRQEGVSVLDASAFGSCADGFVRLCFTVADEQLVDACERIARFAKTCTISTEVA